MPATERTYYNMRRLHVVFAISSVLLLLATAWMLARDHFRPWKEIQRKTDRIEARLAKWKRLEAERTSTYFNYWGVVPVPGRKWLELPFLDAFNSPRKIENLWSKGLDRPAGSFGRVPRFDRCTTCHQRLAKTLSEAPGQPEKGRPTTIDFALSVPEAVNDAARGDREGDSEQLESLFGLVLADEGLVDRDDVTIRLVNAAGPAGTACQWRDVEKEMKAEQIRRQFWRAGEANRHKPSYRGLRLGDVIVAIDGEPVPEGAAGQPWVTDRLLDAASAESDGPKPIRVTVRRGLPHPYAQHPRLGLFVDEDSPHKASEFGCTVCHAGQGSATSFKWASHTPNDLRSRRRWREQYDWFDNPHWDYPMRPAQFLESSCLKCHHDVVELERNSEFPDAPAPKLVKGYRLIRTLGCFGCHEIRGYSHSNRRIGPDLRLEPNYHAAALQLKGAPGTGYQRLTPAERRTVNRLIHNPRDDSPRKTLVDLLRNDAARITNQSAPRSSSEGKADDNAANDGPDEPRFSEDVSRKLLPLLESTDIPGSLRKVGPSLRFVRHKLAPDYLREWIREPRRLRPSTRMPHSFGLWNHLPGEQLRARRSDLRRELAEANDAPLSAKSRSADQIEADLAAVSRELERVDEMEKRFEPVAIHAMARYLLERSQAYDFVQPPSGITPVVTAEDKQARIERGKIAFQELGCLACHDHVDFPGIQEYRDPEYVVQGPDLSNLAVKFENSPNSNGSKWLYSWLAQPTRYSPRTVMPETMAEPVEHRDADGRIIAVTDPLADVVAYLLEGPDDDGRESGKGLQRLDENSRKVLSELTLTYLKDTFPETKAKQYARTGIPYSRQDQVHGAERELLARSSGKEFATTDESTDEMTRKRLFYVARESFQSSGCCGCHDIPGMEDARAIGPDLNDWGHKDTRELAFGRVDQYVRRKRSRENNARIGKEVAEASRASSNKRSSDGGVDTRSKGKGIAAKTPVSSTSASAAESVWSPAQYLQELERHTRIGFLHQKLSEPRSFDYHQARNKKYTDRLRMPRFSLTASEREAIMTFVLGLVANPPRQEYVYSPAPDKEAIFQGHEVLTKYSCRGCHMQESETWELEFPPGEFDAQSEVSTYPFVKPRFSPAERERSRRLDRNGSRHAKVSGMPALSADGLPLVLDDFEFPIEEEPNEAFNLSRLIYPFDLWQPALVDGHPYQVGQMSLGVSAEHLKTRERSFGGALTKYLLPRVVEREREINRNAQGSEAWAWLPPHLGGEGLKVQPHWLHGYLLEPYPIRPAMVMRMPRYNMSSREAATLVDFFTARDEVAYPFNQEPTRLQRHLDAADRKYAEKLKQLVAEGELEPFTSPNGRHLADAMRILTDSRYCVACHVIGDYEPPGSERVKAPDLAVVHERLRGDYLREWLAEPTSIQPYTPMPVNIPYDADAPLQGSTVPQELYHGNSTEQLNALVDLLMNFDRYSWERSPVTPLVREKGADQ
ncbi:MAG: hypothetical protein R6U98_16545 [Pirellulaceae bacterium]